MRRVGMKARRAKAVSGLFVALAALTLISLMVLAASCGTSFSANALMDTPDTGTDANDASVIIVMVPPQAADAASSDATRVDAAVPCDTTGEPSVETCLVDESHAVFVSAAGTSTGTGTRQSPANTINGGLTLAASGVDGGTSKIVIVCGGQYDEMITIDATRDKPRVFGGFTCAGGTWTYVGSGTSIPVLVPSAQGVPLTLTGLTSALFADLEIDAQSAPPTPPDAGSASGASSIAVVATSSMGIEFRRAKIVAGNGQPGADGVLVLYVFPDASTLRGNPATNGGAGGLAKAFSCPGNLMTVGGKGGDSPAGAGDPGLPALDGGAGGTVTQCLSSTGGAPGASAGTASNGPGASSVGTPVNGGWQPAPGMPGASGTPGQGGGGGAGVSPGGGGSGGAGACGGAGGGSGGGGGGSVAVLSVSSGLTFTNVAIVCQTAGAGGVGVAGQPGQSQGGNGGVADPMGGCNGGRGGSGGSGGAGGGGAGGVSVGILYKAVAPVLDSMTSSKFIQGSAGVKGAGGVAGTNDGIDGTTGVQRLAQ